MRLVRLRRQMLLAIGLPACWSSPQAPAPSGPAEPPAKVATGVCRPDTIPEKICGSVDTEHKPESTCGPRGDSLASFGDSVLYVTSHDWTARAAALRHFRLDAKATASYRTTLTSLDPAWLPGYCCYSRCSPLHASREVPVDIPPGYHIEDRCIPAPPGGTRHPDKQNRQCPDAIRIGGAQRNYTGTEGTNCCYGVTVADPPPMEQRRYRGRAARDATGAHVVAAVGHGDSWRAQDAVTVDAIPADVRARLAAHWRETAQMEHASIAAFASLSLRLLALGAPPELVAGAHAAALDEIEHARIAFELASAYADTPLAPLAFTAAAQLPATTTLAELARETFADGCIAETLAALEAELAAETAADPAVAAALRLVAADEARHAELAWQIVAWCVRTDPSVLATLSIDEHGAASPRDEDLAAFGVLGDRAFATARADVLREVVAPCLAALAA